MVLLLMPSALPYSVIQSPNNYIMHRNNWSSTDSQGSYWVNRVLDFEISPFNDVTIGRFTLSFHYCDSNNYETCETLETKLLYFFMSKSCSCHENMTVHADE